MWRPCRPGGAPACTCPCSATLATAMTWGRREPPAAGFRRWVPPGTQLRVQGPHTALCNLIVGNGTVVAHCRCALPPSPVPGRGRCGAGSSPSSAPSLSTASRRSLGSGNAGMLQKQCRVAQPALLPGVRGMGVRGGRRDRRPRRAHRADAADPANPSPPHLAADLKCYTFAGRTRILHYVAGRFVKGGEQLKKDTFFLYTPPPSSSSPRCTNRRWAP